MPLRLPDVGLAAQAIEPVPTEIMPPGGLSSRPDPGDAVAVALRALNLALRQKERGNEAWVLRLLGDIAAHTDPTDSASAAEQ